MREEMRLMSLSLLLASLASLIIYLPSPFIALAGYGAMERSYSSVRDSECGNWDFDSNYARYYMTISASLSLTSLAILLAHGLFTGIYPGLLGVSDVLVLLGSALGMYPLITCNPPAFLTLFRFRYTVMASILLLFLVLLYYFVVNV